MIKKIALGLVVIGFTFMFICKVADVGALIMARHAVANRVPTGGDLDALVPVIVMAESSGNPRAVGPAGERGLMQISRETWERYSAYPWKDAYDPAKNVHVGRKILEEINERYGQTSTRARVIYTYNTGRFCFGPLPKWTRQHDNDIYRSIFLSETPAGTYHSGDFQK
jgi:hypothetical protein